MYLLYFLVIYYISEINKYIRRFLYEKSKYSLQSKTRKITVTVENKDKDGLDTLASTLIKKDIPDKELEMEIENSNGIKIPVNFKNIVRKMYNICNTCYNIGINEMYKDIVKDIIAYKDKVYGIQELKYIIDNRYPKSNTDKKLNNLEYDTMYFI